MTDWFRKRDREYDEEIREHIDYETQENVERGMTPADARRAAQRAFGNAGVLRQRLREARSGYWLSSLVQDARYGVRQLMRTPLLSFAIVVTLTLGIGINTGVFTMLNGLMLRPAVDRDPDTFFAVLPKFKTDEWTRSDLTYRDYVAMRDGARSVRELSARRSGAWALSEDDPAPVRGLLVSCNFFAVYGMDRPKIGRLFQPAECAATASAPVAILSEEIWQARFGSNPDIVGTEIRLNRISFTVIGVTPAAFAGNRGKPTIWVPYTMAPALGSEDFFRTDTTWLQAEGRLAPGYTRAAAQAELAAIVRHQDELLPGRSSTLLITNGTELADPGKRTTALLAFYAVMAAMTLILLIACINVSTLLLSRAAARQTEMAVRLSLGAGGFRLLRMLLTESLILAGVAGALSLWLAYRIPDFIEQLLQTPTRHHMQPDLKVFVYLLFATLGAGCMAGLAPATEALKLNLSGTLKGLTGAFGPRRSRTRNILVGTQVALSVVLVTGAALLVRGQAAAFSGETGFDTAHVLADGFGKQAAPQPEAFFRTVASRIRQLPRVQSVSYTDNVRGADEVQYKLPDRPQQPARQAWGSEVTTEYFATLAIPILRGGVPNPAGASAVVSEKFARAFWPGEDAVGKLIQKTTGGPVLTVVAVSRNARAGLFGEPAAAHLYRLRDTGWPGAEILVRFAGNAGDVERTVRQEMHKIDPRSISSPRTLEALIEREAAPFRTLLQMVFFLGLVAILMAVVGIYGVAAFAVRRRARELGIRVALGANQAEIVRLVMVTGTRPVIVGLAVGMCLALAAAQPLGQLFKTSSVGLDTTDPLTYLAAALVLALAAAAAMFGPAFRAAGVDPVRTLRQD